MVPMCPIHPESRGQMFEREIESESEIEIESEIESEIENEIDEESESDAAVKNRAPGVIDLGHVHAEAIEESPCSAQPQLTRALCCRPLPRVFVPKWGRRATRLEPL
mmetsp:Transcript_73352/g.159068  ORF Transcript_73352/g.159068 Transcript_73352/m.159068 type:complete len:107 (-) Transcript_73352:264-584(-)